MKKIRFSLLILVQILWVASINAQTNVYDTVCVGETSTYYIDKAVPSYPNSFQGGVDTQYSWSLSNENIGSLSATSDATVNITWNSRGEVQLFLTETIRDTMVGVADTTDCTRTNMLYIKIYDTISNSVLAQPSDVNHTLGANVGFVSGLTTPNPDQSIYGVISYQWQKSDSPEGPWNNISGATNHQLNISNISLSDVGYYRCHVTAHCNDVFTDAAHLTIIGAPEIYLQPIGAAICEGSPQVITFRIGANGADNDPLTYQWEKSASPDGPWIAIQGAVDSFYVINQPQVADEGFYHCVVNSVAYPNVNVTSEPCHFEVIDNMVIYFTTNNVTCNGAGNGSIKVDSILNGYPPFSYEWSNGATSNIITDLTPGSYTLHVTEGSSSGCEIEKTVEIDEPLPIRLGIDTSIWEYAQWIHGQDHQLVEDLHVDKVNHNYYQTGSFETELKYGPTTISPGNSGSFDMFVSKVAADGEVQWTRHAGGSTNTYGKGVGTDNEGNVYVGGSFNTTICFYHADNTPGTLLRSHGFENNNYDDDGYIVKYDENGNYVNAITFGGIFNDHIQAIHVNGDGQIFVTGSFEGDITIQGQTISSGSAANVFVARFNSDLSLRWLRAINDQPYEQVGQSIIADVADNTYISGYFQADRNETESSDAIEAPLTQQDLFIARFDFAGDLKWVKTINGTGFLTNGSLAVDYSECVYHTGTFANAAQLRESNGEVMHNYVSAGGSDGFVQKFDRNGYLRWASTVGGTGNDSLKTVATDVLGNTYVAGNFSGELTFNNHTFTSTQGATNAFVAKFANVESNHPYTPFIPTVWGNVIDGNNYQNITTITVDNDQNIYVGGDFSLFAQLGDTLLEADYPKDAFVAHLKDTYISKDPIIVDADCPEDPSGSIQLFISGGTLPYDYVWSISGDTAILDPVESGRYWFWIGDYYNTWDDSICGFNQSLYVEHLHNAPAKPNYITVDTNYFCAGSLMTDQITLTAHTTPTNLTDSIFWREGDCFTGTILNGNAGHTDLDEYSITIDAPTDTTTYYAYWVSEFCGRSLCAAITVYVKPQPVMPESIVSDTNNFCVGSVDSIRLTAIAGSGRIVEWLSDTIEYTIIGTGEHFSIIAPTVSTTYFARWKNECGMSACQSYTINVIPYPASTIYELSEEYCSNSPIDTLIGMPEGGTWSGQGVTRISPTQATFNPAIAIMGINEILYTVSDNGCDSTFVATTIVHAAPQPEFEGLDSAYCYDGANVLLTGSYAPFGTFTCDENPDAIENIGYGKAMFKPTIAGVGGPYHITYIFEDVATGCTESITKTTSVLKPQLTIEGLPETACADDEYITIYGLVDSSYHGGTFTGTGISGHLDPGEALFDPHLTPGIYTVTLTYSNYLGCTSTISQSIEILPTPVSPDTIYVVNGSPEYCYQSVDSLTLAVEGGSGASIQWFLESCGNNAPIIGMGSQIQVEAPKENTSFYARWMNSCGASDCIELQITVDSLPEMSVNGIFEICNNDSTMMTSANRTNCQYVWKDIETGIVLGNEPEIVLAPDFTTWYRQIATNENQCVDSIDFVINVSEPPALELGEDLYMFACDSVELNAGDGIGFEHYLWQDNSIESTYWVKESGVYYVTVYNDGCSITDSVYVEICTDKLFIPNAFSPNGDGLNDYFRPELSDMTLKAEMYIYSRNGGLVFQTERITEGWDGKDLNGQECPNGTYAYLIKYHVKVGVGRTMEKTASGAVIIVK